MDEALRKKPEINPVSTISSFTGVLKRSMPPDTRENREESVDNTEQGCSKSTACSTQPSAHKVKIG